MTIVHKPKYLLNSIYPDKFRRSLEETLRSLEINIIVDDSVDSDLPPTDGKVTTKKGVTLNADMVLSTRGSRPNTEFISASLGSNVLASNGYVTISPTLQLPSHPNIFAAGDIIDFPEQKQVVKYDLHASVVAANIQSVLKGKKPTNEYKGPALEGIVVTIGSKRGAGYAHILCGITFWSWFCSWVKSKELHVSKTRKSMGYIA